MKKLIFMLALIFLFTVNVNATKITANSVDNVYNIVYTMDANVSAVKALLVAGDANTSAIKALLITEDANVSAIKALLVTADANVSAIDKIVDTMDANVSAMDKVADNIYTLAGTMDANISAIDKIVDTMDVNVSAIDKVVDSMDANVSAIDKIVDTMDANVSAIDKIVDTMDANVSAIDKIVDTMDVNVSANQAKLVKVEKVTDPVYGRSGSFVVEANMLHATWNTVASHEIATVTGTVRMRILAECNDTTTGASTEAAISLGTALNKVGLIAATLFGGSEDSNAFQAGEVWQDTTPTESNGIQAFSTGVIDKVISKTDVGYTISSAAGATGRIIFYIWWEALDDKGAVVAGAGGSL